MVNDNDVTKTGFAIEIVNSMHPRDEIKIEEICIKAKKKKFTKKRNIPT